MRNWQWAMAFIVSLVIHGAIASLYLKVEAPEPFGATGVGEGGLEVGLGMQGSYVDSEPLAQNEPVESDKPAEPEPQTPAQDVEESLTAEPESVDQPVQDVADTPVDPSLSEPSIDDSVAEPLPDIDAVVAAESVATAVLPEKKTSRPLNENDKPPDLLPDEKLSTQKKTANSDNHDNVVDPKKASSSARMNQATGIANNRPVGGKVGNARTYLGHLMAWLNKYKKYPTKAKKHKQQGTVKLQFTVDRQGQILDYKIKESSGNPVLDTAALEMLRAAAPLPAMPDDFYPDRQQMPLVIPVEYSLITNRSL
jgi:protein TonB